MSAVGFLSRAARAGGWADIRHHHDHPPVDGAVARVAGQTIPPACLDARIAAIYQGPMRSALPAPESPEGRRIRRWAVQLLATETLVVMEARRLGTVIPPYPGSGPVAANGADPDTEAAVETAVAALFTEVTREIKVSEEELRAYYDANPDLWRRPELRTVRQAVRTTREAVVRALRSEDLGPPYELARGEMTGPVEDAVFATRRGVVGPLRGPLGWHLVQVSGATPAGTEPYERVRADIETELLAAARGAAFDDWLTLRREKLVEIAPGFEHPGDPTTPDFVHRH